jgi:formylmethanofuran dehydrogenase subunit D
LSNSQSSERGLSKLVRLKRPLGLSEYFLRHRKENCDRLMAKSSKLHVTLLTGRTIEQGVAKERGKSSEEYMESVTVCFVDPEDLERLGIEERTNVCVSTVFGSVVLRALKSPRGPHSGIIFVPYGPWVNIVVDPSTGGIGMPSLKGIPAEIEPAPEKSILSLRELLAQQFRSE